MSVRMLARVMAGTAIAVFCLYHSWQGLFVYFHQDDMMNLYRAWAIPPAQLFLQCWNPFTTEVRPAGALLYRVVFSFAGFDPLPFRAVTYALMIANLGLLYLLVRRLTQSAEVAALASIIASHHHRMIGIYANNGTIYDVFVSTIVLILLYFYVDIRERGEFLRGWNLAAFAALFVFAVNVKEMAAALPLLLLAYELTFAPPTIRSGRDFLSWLRCQAVPILLTTAFAAAGVLARVLPGGFLHGNDGYRMTPSIAQFFRSWRALLGEMFYLQSGPNTTKTVLILAGLLGAAWLCRRRGTLFFAIFAILSPLPILFIPYRGFYVMYLPWLAWSVCFAAVIVRCRDLLLERIWHRGPPGPGLQPEGLLLFVIIAQALLLLHPLDATRFDTADVGPRSQIRRMKEQMETLHPALPKGSRILLLNDSFSDGEWTPVFILRLLYRDADLDVQRPKMSTSCIDPRAGFTHVFTDQDGLIRELRRELWPGQACPPGSGAGYVAAR